MLGGHHWVLFGLFVIIRYFLVETSSSWAYPWISWSLSLSLHILNYFLSLGGHSGIWVNQLILEVLLYDPLSVSWRATNILVGWSMVDKMRIVDIWCNAYVAIDQHRGITIAAHIMTLLPLLGMHLACLSRGSVVWHYLIWDSFLSLWNCLCLIHEVLLLVNWWLTFWLDRNLLDNWNLLICICRLDSRRNWLVC